MVFSSPLFLFAFLPVFLTAYWCAPRRWRNATALLGSLLFYAFGAPAFVFVLVGSVALDYRISCLFAGAAPRRRRELLVLSLSLNLGLLLYFKYANFLVAEVEALVRACGGGPLPWTAVALPIGISFFTFQKLSYVLDVYRGVSRPAASFLDCLLYVALFPQLIAGPIVRYHDIDWQIRHRSHDAERFWSGVVRFTVGLAKKVLIANSMAEVADQVYALETVGLPTVYAWIGAACYYFQIYFDFSGYSDMAIGLGRMMGFEFLENFDRPYTARTFTEFWRRWHISLSNWMREYLYIPLGGNRVAPWRAYRNLWVVFLVSGLWHGAAWTFVVWGIYQGVFLTLDKLFFLRLARHLPDLVLRVGMVFLVLISWVFFRSESLPAALDYLGCMFRTGGPPVLGSAASLEVDFGNHAGAMLALAAAISFAPWFGWWTRLERRFVAFGRTPVGSWVEIAWVGGLLVLTSMALVNSTYNPFIYFRF